jgi:hypothetical protein
MAEMNRRGFLKMAGVGTALAAGAVIPDQLFGSAAGPIAIRAVGGVPAAPLPSYASYVLDGYIDPVRKTGTLTRTVLAGHPGAMSAIALPGLSQTVQIVDIRREDSLIRLTGIVVDRSQLHPGESAEVDIRIDRAGGLVWGKLGANEVKLTLKQ